MKRLLLAISLFTSIHSSNAQGPIEVGNKFQIDSDVLDEERELWIGLPLYYDSTVAYPVIYVLDAEWQFDITLAMTKELAANDKIPAHIVVGIPHVDRVRRFNDLTFTGTELRSDGTLDSTLIDFFGPDKTGGGNQFYDHLVKEVLPFVESKHKTNGFDVFIGHSLSGLYGAYLISKDGPFDAFQLYDPSIWYNGGDVIDSLAGNLPVEFNSNVFMSTAAGGKERQQYNVDTQEKLHKFLRKRGINSTLNVYENEDHGTVRLPSLIDGLSHLYDGFSIGFIMPTDKITVSDAHAHYAAFSEKVSYEFSCPEGAYRWIGHANHAQGNWAEAIKAYNFCQDLFTEDPLFQKEVAESYFGIGDYTRSLSIYGKWLVLEPENKDVIQKIEELKRLTKK